ncbi:MAG: hypothetical protein PHV32_02685 [Eubacteriales bacterium]|nr:hypothetical protein [Eubacteriales bacterium]
MRKNRIFILFAVVLVLTLVSTSLVAGTYAKYTKEVTGTDTARVAKFAFNLKDGATKLADQTTDTSLDPISINLFDTVDEGLYSNGLNGTFIAPGTTGSLELSVDNLSEVDIAVAFDLTETNDDSIPIYYTIGAGTQRYSAVLSGSYGAESYKPLTDLATDVNTLAGTVEASDGSVAESLAGITLNWTYAFDSAGTGQTDADDTALGIAGTATVKLDVACTVTQVN